MKNKNYKIIVYCLFIFIFFFYGKITLAESSRRLPNTYVVHTYGTTGFFHSLQDWEDLTTVNLASVTTVDQSSSGNTLYVADTSLFEDAEMNKSTITVNGQILTITGVTAGESLTVSDISGTINSSTAIQTGFVLTCYEDAPYNDLVLIDGAINTSGNYFRVIRAEEGQRGTPTSGVRFYQNGFYGSIIKSTEDYVGIYDIAVTGSGNNTIIGIDVGGIYSKIVGCTAYNITCPTGTYQIAMGLRAIGNFSVIANSYATGVSGAWNYYGAISFTNGSGTKTYYSYNNTSKGNKINLYIDGNGGSAVVYSKNNILMNASYQNIMQFNFGGATTLNQTTNKISGVTFDSDGYHLDSSDGIATNQGTSLNPDPGGFFSFDDDIDGNTRPYNSIWDVGADEYAITHNLAYITGPNGSITGDSSQTVNKGSDGTAVTAVPDTNYHFVDWSDGSTDNPRTDTNVTEDITVTANFSIDTYTVDFEDYDGTNLKTETVDHGSSATAPADPIRTGYTFIGWDVDFSNIISNLTVSAEYSINVYTVDFEDYDGSNLKTETVNYGSSATAPADPTRTGYTFTGWDVDFSNITSNLTVTAEYSANPEPEKQPQIETIQTTEEEPIIKIKSIKEYCDSIKLEFSTGGEEKKEDLDIKVEFKNQNTGEKNTQKLNAETDRDGRDTITIEDLEENTEYKTKIKYKRDNRDEYSDWSDSEDFTTTTCPVSLITTPLYAEDQSFPGQLDNQEEEIQVEDEDAKEELEPKEEIIPITKQEPKEISQEEEPKIKGFWNTIIKGASNIKKAVKESPGKFFFLLILLLVIIIAAIIAWLKRKNRG